MNLVSLFPRRPWLIASTLMAPALGLCQTPTTPAMPAPPAQVTAPARPALRASEAAAREARIQWFREAKFGLFIHWGLYSIPAGYWKGQRSPGLGEWIMNR